MFKHNEGTRFPAIWERSQNKWCAKKITHMKRNPCCLSLLFSVRSYSRPSFVFIIKMRRVCRPDSPEGVLAKAHYLDMYRNIVCRKV